MFKQLVLLLPIKVEKWACQIRGSGVYLQRFDEKWLAAEVSGISSAEGRPIRLVPGYFVADKKNWGQNIGVDIQG